MIDKQNLRKADIFSGAVISLFGLWIVSQALKMPMKDSWGGVQNVWYVSPALFPLFVGAMIALLGALLARTALKSVGIVELGRTLTWFWSSDLVRFLGTPAVIRFYAMAVLFFGFVFLNIPRIDFFLCSVILLVVFISMFHLDDDTLLIKLLLFYLAGTVIAFIFFALEFPKRLEGHITYAGDWLTLAFILAYCMYAWVLVRSTPVMRRKYRTSLILGVIAPFLIGPIFKYLLLVPMPTEGLVVTLMDAIRYWDF